MALAVRLGSSPLSLPDKGGTWLAPTSSFPTAVQARWTRSLFWTWSACSDCDVPATDKPIERRQLLPHRATGTGEPVRSAEIAAEIVAGMTCADDGAAFGVMRGRCGDFGAIVEDGVAYNCDPTPASKLSSACATHGDAVAGAVHHGCMRVARRARGSQLVADCMLRVGWCMPSVSYGESTVPRMVAKQRPKWKAMPAPPAARTCSCTRTDALTTDPTAEPSDGPQGTSSRSWHTDRAGSPPPPPSPRPSSLPSGFRPRPAKYTLERMHTHSHAVKSHTHTQTALAQ